MFLAGSTNSTACIQKQASVGLGTSTIIGAAVGSLAFLCCVGYLISQLLMKSKRLTAEAAESAVQGIRSITYDGLFELIGKYKKYWIKDQDKYNHYSDAKGVKTRIHEKNKFTSRTLKRIFEEHDLFPRQDASNLPYFSNKDPDIIFTYTWDMDLENELPRFMNKLEFYLDSEKVKGKNNQVISRNDFRNQTFWIDIFYNDQRKGQVPDLAEATKFYLNAWLHFVLLAHHVLERGWCLFEISKRVDSQIGIYRARDDLESGCVDLTNIPNLIKVLKDPVGEKTFNVMTHTGDVEKMAYREFHHRLPLLIACPEVENSQEHLLKYAGDIGAVKGQDCGEIQPFDALGQMKTSYEDDKKRLTEAINVKFKPNDFNLIIQAIAEKTATALRLSS